MLLDDFACVAISTELELLDLSDLQESNEQ